MEAGMKIAVVLQAFDKMSSVVNKAVTSAEGKLKAFKKTSDAIAKTSFDFGKQSGAFGLGVGALLAAPIKAAADMERMNIALRTSFQGNAAEAKKAFDLINKFAGTTPYELEEVMTGFVKLKNMGLDPSIEALTAYGNTASAMGKSLNDMVEAVADAATGEFERLKEFGIKTNSEGNKVSFTFQGVKTTIGKNSKEIEAYLKKIGLTKFAGGIEEQSKSIYGQLSTLNDNVRMTMAKMGETIIPTLNKLFAKIGPMIDKISAWVQKNKELTGTIMKTVGGLAAFSMSVSALSFLFGGVAKTLSVFVSVSKRTMQTVGWLTDKKKGLGHWIFVARYRLMQLSEFVTGKAIPMLTKLGSTIARVFRTIGAALASVGRFLLANPIILIITGIAVAAFLIYKYWSQIKTFFIQLWDKIKVIFSVAWNGIKNMFLTYHPAGLIIKHWDKISGFFSNLWGNVRNIFSGFFKWFVSLHKMFFNAGVNIVKSIWEGIKTFASKPFEAIRGMVQKIRNLLPFSPAKEGPLRDIHKIRLVETIAESIKPNALLSKMHRVSALTFNAINGNPGRQLAPATVGGHTTISPTFHFHLSGSVTKQEAKMFSAEMEKQFTQMMKKYQDRQRRLSFG